MFSKLCVGSFSSPNSRPHFSPVGVGGAIVLRAFNHDSSLDLPWFLIKTQLSSWTYWTYTNTEYHIPQEEVPDVCRTPPLSEGQLSMDWVTCDQLWSGSRWSSFWSIIRRSIVANSMSQCLRHSLHFISSLQERQIYSSILRNREREGPHSYNLYYSMSF